MKHPTSADIPAIPQARAAQLVGGQTIVTAAMKAGVFVPTRTQTGRVYLTGRQLDRLLRFAADYRR